MIDFHKYLSSMMYNMDKTGFALGASAQSTHVLIVIKAHHKRQKAKKLSSGCQDWCISIQYISAPGIALTPFAIFKGTTRMRDTWIPCGGTDVKGWQWAVSNKGWSNNTLTSGWRKDVFEPQT